MSGGSKRNFPPSKPMSSSMLTKQVQGKTVYANYLIQQERLQQGCREGVNLDIVGVARGSIISDLSTGENATTIPQRQAILNSGSCSPVPRPLTVPFAPVRLSATTGNMYGIVSFLQPFDGGSPITNYAYSFDGLNFTFFDPPQTESPFEFDALTNGTLYTIYLKAFNNIGLSPSSTGVSFTPYTTPSAPYNLYAVPQDMGGKLFFTPNSTGGRPITNYAYSFDNITFVFFEPPQTQSPLSFNNLTNGTTYYVSIASSNAAGLSAPSTQVNLTPPDGLIVYLDASNTSSLPTLSNVGAWGSEASMTFSGDYSVDTEDGRSIVFTPNVIATTDNIGADLTARTLTWWVKLTDVNNRGGGFSMNHYTQDVNQHDNFEAIDWDEQNAGWLYGSSYFERSGYNGNFGTLPLNNTTGFYDNTWHMITAVYSSNYNMYVDGILSFTITTAQQVSLLGIPFLQRYGLGNPSDPTPYRMCLGPRDGGTPYYGNSITGKVGTVAVYDYELSPTQILELYNSTKDRFIDR